MKRHVLCALIGLAWLPNTGVPGGEPPASSEPKKLSIKPPLPPFPDTSPEKLLIPVQAPELAPRQSRGDGKTPYAVIGVAPAPGAAPVPGAVAVGFFNHSERDLVLEINDRPVKLGSRYYLQLKLARQFTWREKDGLLQTTKVPADADGVEIVFRK